VDFRDAGNISMNLKPIILINGIFLLIIGALMLVPCAVDFSLGDMGYKAFLLGSGFSEFFGCLMVLSSSEKNISLDLRQGLLLTTTSWIVISAFSAVPLVFGLPGLSFTDAFFETMSGLTTTGSTVLTQLETLPHGILLWRSMLQWVGGVGIIAMAIVILPFLRVGGMQLFKAESSDRSDKVFPRVQQIAGAIALVYVVLTLACGLLYAQEGMTAFEAVNHAMTTLSTGGFSTSDGSMGAFHNPSVLWTSTVFMLLGGMPFVLYVKAIHGNLGELLLNSQVRSFLVAVVLVTFLITTWLVHENNFDALVALRISAFNIVSIITTTGYASTDYTLWGTFPVAVLFFLTLVGGCTGSTAGGLKIFRFEIMYRFLKRQLQMQLYPHGSYVSTYNKRHLPDEIMRSTGVFIFLFVLAVAALSTALTFTGLDILTSISGAFTAVANVGPGFGDTIGPAGNFSTLPDVAKWLLSFGMLLGRLEVLTVLLLFSRSYWQE